MRKLRASCKVVTFVKKTTDNSTRIFDWAAKHADAKDSECQNLAQNCDSFIVGKAVVGDQFFYRNGF